jgi:hypothetical protein
MRSLVGKDNERRDPRAGGSGTQKQEIAEVCSHGTDRNLTCSACVQDSISRQPAWNRIAELMSKSKYERSAQAPECTIQHNGKHYEIRMVKVDEIDLIRSVHSLMEASFDKGEIDPIEITQAAIRGALPNGGKDITRYRIFIADDKKTDEIIATFSGGLLDLLTPMAPSDREAMFMEAYAVTRIKSQLSGIFRELYISSLMQAATDAQAERALLTLVVGECTWHSEHAWNAVGQKRIYIETSATEYTELPYIQPPVDWDAETGLAAEGAGNVPEHLMLEFLDNKPSKGKVLSAISGIYRWNNMQPRDIFSSSEAYSMHKYLLGQQTTRLENFMYNNRDLKLLSASDRHNLRKQGIKIHEYSDADP